MVLLTLIVLRGNVQNLSYVSDDCIVKESESRSVVSDSATPWTVAWQAPLSMEFSRPEYQSR